MVELAAPDNQAPAPHEETPADFEIRKRTASAKKTIQRIPQARKVPTATRHRIDDLSVGSCGDI